MMALHASEFSTWDDQRLLAELKRIWRSISPVPEDEYLCVYDASFKLIEHTASPETIGNYIGDNIVLGSDAALSCTLSELAEQGTEYVGEYISSSREKQIAAFTKLPERNWGIGVHRSYREVVREVRTAYNPILFALLAISVVLLPSSLLLLYGSFRRAERSREQAFTATEKALKEQEVLLKELHHRVKNNLQIVSSMLSLTSRSRASKRDMLEGARGRIKNMALIHDQLYRIDSISKIPFATYVENLSRDILSTLTVQPGQVRLVIRIEKLILPVDTAIPCGLIINELITNSVKYAFNRGLENKIEIAFSVNDENQGVLTYGDSGPGYDPEITGQSPTLGLTLVKTFVEQIEGTLEIQRTGGFSMVITFPLPLQL